MIFIVIPVFNRLNYTKACIKSLKSQSYQNFKLVVIDHGSTDGTSEYLSSNYNDIILLKGDSSMWWTGAINCGVKYALDHGATYILTLNNDLIVEENYLKNLLHFIEKRPNSIVGSISVDINNRNKVSFAGTKWNSWIATYKHAIDINIPHSSIKEKYEYIVTDLLPGRGTFIPRIVFEKIGLFDEKNFPHYMADEDFSLKAAKLGYKLFVDPNSVVFSHINDTGLSNIYKNKFQFSYLKASFTSIRSPNKLSTRLKWAINHAKIPPLYFFLDFNRVLISQFIKIIKQ